MYVSRLTFHCQPGKTGEVQEQLKKLLALAAQAGAGRPRILRSHFASLGAPDVVFEQEAPDLATLEEQIKKVTDTQEFQQWTGHMSSLLSESPKREIYLVAGSG